MNHYNPQASPMSWATPSNIHTPPACERFQQFSTGSVFVIWITSLDTAKTHAMDSTYCTGEYEFQIEGPTFKFNKCTSAFYINRRSLVQILHISLNIQPLRALETTFHKCCTNFTSIHIPNKIAAEMLLY